MHEKRTMSKVLIVGCGGHGEVIADALSIGESNQKPIGFVDDNSSFWGKEVCGLPIYGSINQIHQIEYDELILSIGNNQIRKSIFEHLIAQGERFATVIHPHSTIATNVSIGQGTFIAAQAVIATGGSVGNNTIINTSSSVDHHNKIGHHLLIGPGVHLGGEVIVGDEALIGIGATVLPQRSIGEKAIVGAGAVVTTNVPAGLKVFGIPAKPR